MRTVAPDKQIMASAASRYLEETKEKARQVADERARVKVEVLAREEVRNQQPKEKAKREMPEGARPIMSGKLWLKVGNGWEEVGCNYHHDMDGNRIFRYALPGGEQVVANCRLSGGGERLVNQLTGAQEARTEEGRVVVEIGDDHVSNKIHQWDSRQASELEAETAESAATGRDSCTKNLFLFSIHGGDAQLELGVESHAEKQQWLEAVPSIEVKVCFEEEGLYVVMSFATGQSLERCRGSSESDLGILHRNMAVEGTYTRWRFWKLPSKRYQSSRTLQQHYKEAAAALFFYKTTSMVYYSIYFYKSMVRL
jgi:hypothetical protein